MTRRALVSVSAFICLAFAALLPAQDPNAPRTPGNPGGERLFGKKEKPPDKTRSVSGKVFSPKDEIVEGAVVQLKDTKTLEVRSFITLEDGTFRFHGLSTETDYELRATHDGRSSKTRRLSVYDSRRDAVVNLKLRPEA